ncbi:MAG: carbon-nitrogen hydrolase family protein [Campylobacterota bacterium]|nr:carbon-nitrogen hydrolase family protein [Campylobacterota bacterium]
MTTSKNLVSLRFASTANYEQNLATLIDLIEEADQDSIILAPEVCLSGFDYEHFDKAARFSTKAIEKLFLHVKHKTLILTVIEHKEDGVYNVAKVLHYGKVIHEQSKACLFKLGDEHDYFLPGDQNKIMTFKIDELKVGILICFELRFKKLWQQLEGADLIVVAARWGALRSQNFVSLTNALAIMNQCYVLASDASNKEFSAQSGIITPFGKEKRNGTLALLSEPFEHSEVKKMRRYLDVGIS